MYAIESQTGSFEPGVHVYCDGHIGVIVQVYERVSLDKDDHLVIWFPAGLPRSLAEREDERARNLVTIDRGFAHATVDIIPKFVGREVKTKPHRPHEEMEFPWSVRADDPAVKQFG